MEKMTAVARLLALALMLGEAGAAKEFPYEALGSVDVSTGESSIFMMNNTRECRAPRSPLRNRCRSAAALRLTALCCSAHRLPAGQHLLRLHGPLGQLPRRRQVQGPLLRPHPRVRDGK